MRPIQLCLTAMLCLWSLAACASLPEKAATLPATATPESTIPLLSPADPTITANADVVQLLDHLKQRGISVGDPQASRAAFLYPIPGVAYEFDGGRLYVHLFPNAQAAQQRANQIPPEMTPSVIDWVDKPHFYRCKSTIVLYLGTNARVMQALTEFCGAEFAGS